jgi:hypothetical protein
LADLKGQAASGLLHPTDMVLPHPKSLSG